MTAIEIGQGFTEAERAEVSALYWEAFARKLRPGFATEERARVVIREAMRRDHMLVARRAGEVLGVCGFYEGGVGASEITWVYLRTHLGFFASLRAAVMLIPLARPVAKKTLVLDGICVSTDARGLGIGSALLDAITELAQEKGVGVVQLSVVNNNPRARALYERRGFMPIKTRRMWPLSGVFGFTAYTTLERGVERGAAR